MKTVLGIGIVAGGLLLVAPAGHTQDKDKGHPPDEPGAIHKDLARRAGEYTTVSKFTIKPGEAMETRGTAKLKSVVDGRFLLDEHTGTMLGKPYTGLRLMGYNNVTKKYEAFWTYSMATGMMTLTGTSKDEGKGIDWTASYVDAKGDKQTLYVLTRFVDDDHFTVELYSKTADGTKGVSIETTYTRKK